MIKSANCNLVVMQALSIAKNVHGHLGDIALDEFSQEADMNIITSQNAATVRVYLAHCARHYDRGPKELRCEGVGAMWPITIRYLADGGSCARQRRQGLV